MNENLIERGKRTSIMPIDDVAIINSEDVYIVEDKPIHMTPEQRQRFDMAYLAGIGFLILLLCVALIKWRLDVKRTNYETAIATEAVEVYKAELQAKIEEESAARTMAINSEANIRKSEIEMVARLFEGVRGFNFDKKSLMTLAWVAFDRIGNPIYGETFYDVIHQDGQWIGYSDSTPIAQDYYRIAEEAVNELHNRTVRPFTTDFTWIEIIDGELWAKNAFENTSFRNYKQWTEWNT